MTSRSQALSRSRSIQISEICAKEWIFWLGVLFHFLCLPPKGFSIDKALAFAGSAVDEKPLMGRLVMGTEGTWRVGVAVLMKGWESTSMPTDRNRPTRRGSQV